MVLVDTSVWIRFLSGRSPYSARLAELLEHGDVCGHDFVAGELLIGDKGGRQLLLTDYALMRQLPVVPHDDVVEFVRARRLHGRGIGWVDTHLLASALISRVSLWTADSCASTMWQVSSASPSTDVCVPWRSHAEPSRRDSR